MPLFGSIGRAINQDTQHPVVATSALHKDAILYDLRSILDGLCGVDF